MMEEVRKFITTETELFQFGINLRMEPFYIEQIRTDNPHSIILAACKLAFKYYVDSPGTKDEKLEVFHKSLVDMGKVSATRFENNNNV